LNISNNKRNDAINVLNGMINEPNHALKLKAFEVNLASSTPLHLAKAPAQLDPQIEQDEAQTQEKEA
jgi:hypothetical protein